MWFLLCSITETQICQEHSKDHKIHEGCVHSQIRQGRKGTEGGKDVWSRGPRCVCMCGYVALSVCMQALVEL